MDGDDRFSAPRGRCCLDAAPVPTASSSAVASGFACLDAGCLSRLLGSLVRLSCGRSPGAALLMLSSEGLTRIRVLDFGFGFTFGFGVLIGLRMLVLLSLSGFLLRRLVVVSVISCSSSRVRLVGRSPLLVC